jgi:hypothetical protein
MEAKALIQSGIENVNRALSRSLNGLTPEELKWKPKPDANSIGFILFHMARSQDFFLNSETRKTPQIWETEKWYLKLKKDVKDSGSQYTPEQYQTFVVPDLKETLAYFEAVNKQMLDFLKSLSTEGLDAEVVLLPHPPMKSPDGKNLPPQKPPFEPKVGSLLFFSIIHLLEHCGEISYIRGLIRGMDK